MPSSVHPTTQEAHKPRSQRYSRQQRHRFAKIYGGADSLLDAYGIHDELSADGDSSSDDSSIYSQDDSNRNIHSKHNTYSSKDGTSNAAFENPSAPFDDDAQYGRPSWTGHRATSDSCADLVIVDSSRPSTLIASDGATTHKSNRKALRYSFATTVAADSDAAKRNGIWQAIDDLAEIVASAASNESIEAKQRAGPAPQVENQFASSAPTQTIEAASTQEVPTHVVFGSSKSQTPSMKLEDAAYPENPRIHRHAEKGTKPGFVVYEIEKDGHNDQEMDEERLQRRRRGAQVLRRTSRLAQILIWTVMITFPLFFITLGVLTALISGKPGPSKIGNGVAAANKIAVSVWPIVFAAIIAQSLRMYASFRAERGIPLITLEQLISSHSFGSAIKQPFVHWSWIGLLLLCLWSLSPLAGQALLHMSYQGLEDWDSSHLYSYLNTSGDSNVFGGVSSGASYSSNVDSIFGASIFSSDAVQQAPTDPWNNTKIPILPERKPDDVSGWIEVDDKPTYSSLLGVPIANFPVSLNTSSTIIDYQTNITIRSTYYAFDCPALIPGNLSQIQQVAHIQNIDLLRSSTGTLWLGLLPPQGKQPGQLLFVSKLVDSSDLNRHFYTTCNFTPSHVESEVDCTNDYCWVNRMRPDLGPGLPTSQTPLAKSLLNMLQYFIHSGSPLLSPDQPSPKEYYLADSSNANSFSGNLDLSTVPADEFTQRLSLLFNTYWQASIVPCDYTGKVIRTTTDPLLEQNATITISINVYRADWAWLAVLLVSSTILLVAAVAGAIWNSRLIVGPEFFGVTSSLAHRNRYMRVPSGESTIGGVARARQLRDMRVMLQDVAPDQQVGKMVLGTVEGNGGQRLKLGRMYR